MPTLLWFPAAYRPYLEAELKRIEREIQQDQYERGAGKVMAPSVPLVPREHYDATATGDDVVVLVTEHRTPVIRALQMLEKAS